MKKIISMVVALSAVSAFAENFKGKIYDMEANPNDPIFSFERTERMENGKKIVEGKYFDLKANSSVALVEKLTYGSAEKQLFDLYEFERQQTNEKAVVEIKDKKVFYKLDEAGKKTENKESLDENTVNRDELVAFVQKNWDKFANADKLKFRFVLPDRAETIGFALRKKEEVQVAGRAAYRAVMFAQSMFVAAVAGDTYLTFEKEGKHRLLRVEGRTPVMKKIGKEFKTLKGRIEFEYL